MRAVGSCNSIGSDSWDLPLCRPLLRVLLWPVIYLVYWIGPVIDVVRENLDFTMGGEFWIENRFIGARCRVL